MDLFKGPTDVFGMAIYNSLSQKIEQDYKYRDFINDLNEKIVIEMDYYPLMIKFEENNFQVTRDIEEPTIKLKIAVQDFLDIIDGKSSIIGLFLKRKLKIKKGMLKIFKIFKIFSKMMS
ncbi:MAG: SCP2 sterol-binding domain-containing protein [Candidatus Helarchaeota archaeon]